MTLEKKIELAAWISAHNHQVALTGSLMLYLKSKAKNIDEFYLGREPNDIDFVIDSKSDKDLILPPFIEKVESGYSESTGYPVLARFWYDGVKIEFIETDYLRYETFDIHSLVKSSQLLRNEDIDKCKEFGHINMVLICDLIAAKKAYIEEDEDKNYIEKTKQDLDKILYEYTPDHYKYEYTVILQNYFEKPWYYLAKGKDVGRKFIDNLIFERHVKENKSKERWYYFLTDIDHSFHEKYIMEKHKNQPHFDFAEKYITVDEYNTIDKIVYDFYIPKFV